MSNIRTYNDLLEEKKRLEAALVLQREVIRQDIIELREEFKPALHLISTVGKITTRSLNNPLLALGVNLLGGMLVKNVMLAGSSKITQLVVPFLVRKFPILFQNQKTGGIIQKLAGIWKNKSNGHS